MRRLLTAFTCVWFCLGGAVPLTGRAELAAQDGPDHAANSLPLQLHPANPHYFLFRGRPALLITSGEHYGAVLNAGFDYLRYLDELELHGFNLTRVFSGTYREVPGAFSITGNTLAPSMEDYLCPWARSDVPGATDGGNKFDLTRWDPRYFRRLHDFVGQAGKRGIVVEVVLFCTMYDQKLWEASPLHVRNNIQGIGDVSPHQVYSGQDAELMAVQERVARKLVAELNSFDNVYFEICNEPYERQGLTRQWHDRIVQAIVDTEAGLPFRHLIAQGIALGAARATDLNAHVDVLNFHAAKPQTVSINYQANRPIAYDETGGADRSDWKYRTDGWKFILAGGAVYNHLDFSFTPQSPDGSAVPLPSGTPGGGGPQLRRQLGVLKQFMEQLDFIRMAPAQDLVLEWNVTPADARPADSESPIWVLADHGKAYAVYIAGGTRAEWTWRLPAGTYRAEWIDPKRGNVVLRETRTLNGEPCQFTSPTYDQDLALRLMRTDR